MLSGISIYGNVTSFNNSIKNIAHQYYTKFNHKKVFSPIFSPNDINIVKNLQLNNNIVITRPDKGRGVVVLNKSKYVEQMNEILSDSSKYTKIHNANIFKHITCIEDKLNRITRNLNTPSFPHHILHTSGSSPGIMYGVPKIHKPNIPLRPVLSSINTPSYKLAKTFIPFLSHLTTNQYTLKDSFQLAELIQHISFPQSFLTSFDITNLFTNVPIKETINIITSKLFPTPAHTRFKQGTISKITHSNSFRLPILI